MLHNGQKFCVMYTLWSTYVCDSIMSHYGVTIVGIKFQCNRLQGLNWLLYIIAIRIVASYLQAKATTYEFLQLAMYCKRCREKCGGKKLVGNVTTMPLGISCISGISYKIGYIQKDMQNETSHFYNRKGSRNQTGATKLT